jgi:hypothetical protein
MTQDFWGHLANIFCEVNLKILSLKKSRDFLSFFVVLVSITINFIDEA